MVTTEGTPTMSIARIAEFRRQYASICRLPRQLTVIVIAPPDGREEGIVRKSHKANGCRDHRENDVCQASSSGIVSHGCSTSGCSDALGNFEDQLRRLQLQHPILTQGVFHCTRSEHTSLHLMDQRSVCAHTTRICQVAGRFQSSRGQTDKLRRKVSFAKRALWLH